MFRYWVYIFQGNLLKGIGNCSVLAQLITSILFLIFQIDQQGSLWTFQARRMNGDMGSFQVLPDQMQLANPFM